MLKINYTLINDPTTYYCTELGFTNPRWLWGIKEKKQQTIRTFPYQPEWVLKKKNVGILQSRHDIRLPLITMVYSIYRNDVLPATAPNSNDAAGVELRQHCLLSTRSALRLQPLNIYPHYHLLNVSRDSNTSGFRKSPWMREPLGIQRRRRRPNGGVTRTFDRTG